MLNLRQTVAGLAAACAIAAGTPAICADAPTPNPHSMELARKLFSEMHMDTLMGDMMRQMAPAMLAQARARNPTVSEADVRAIQDATAESMQAMMAKMNERAIPLYASTFSEKELQDLVNFYDSPTGQAMLAKMPVLMNKLAPLATDLMPEMMADMTKRICAKTDCSKHATPAAPKS
jgi:uncharacterized protein